LDDSYDDWSISGRSLEPLFHEYKTSKNIENSSIYQNYFKDIAETAVSSDGVYLNSTIWFHRTLNLTYNSGSAYGILIDVDDNQLTGLYGYDYASHNWKSRNGTWYKDLIELSNIGSRKIHSDVWIPATQKDLHIST
jgi:hypothetical protein